MLWKKRLGFLGALGLVLAVNGCSIIEELLGPCKVNSSQLYAMGSLDGNWDLRTIDGQPIPRPGYLIPGKGVYLRQGTLHLTDSSVDIDPTCTRLLQSSGVAEAEYATSDKPNGEIKYASYWGRYARDHEADVTLLGAAGHSLPVTVTGQPTPNTITAVAEVKVFGVGVTYRLVFQRN